MCFPCIYLFLSFAVCAAQGELSSSPILVPVQAMNSTSDSTCPSEFEHAEARQQLKTIILSALDEYSRSANPLSSCSDLPPNSTTGYYWISSAGAPAVEKFCDLTETYPITSCYDLPSRSPAGYYWILPSTGPPAVQRFCDVGAPNQPGGCGGETSSWTRVGFLNMLDPNQNCPNTWVSMISPRRTCGRGKNAAAGCNSELFPTGIAYSQVCGRIVAYHNGGSDGFDFLANSVEHPYLDGISLTHGPKGSRQHIWSFVAAIGEVGSFHSSWLCDCSNGNDWPHSVPFIGNNYFCDTGYHGMSRSGTASLLNYNDPLWDGQGCGRNSTCCQFNNPPWFHVTLPQPTTDDLEVRNCQGYFSGYDSLVELIEIYVQ